MLGTVTVWGDFLEAHGPILRIIGVWACSGVRLIEIVRNWWKDWIGPDYSHFTENRPLIPIVFERLMKLHEKIQYFRRFGLNFKV